MALEGRLEANFSSFYDAVDKATVKFRSFEDEAAKVEKRLNTVTDGFSGRRVIQEATLMAEAIQRVGVSTLTTGEAARSLSTLDHAMDKLLRTGQQVPIEMSRTAAELRRVGQATDAADASVSRITANYRQFDGVLQSMGINIGPYVKGLEDVIGFAGKGATALGLFGTAGAVVATALTALKIGNTIGEITGLDDWIGKTTASLLGYGDVAAETAAAQQEALNGALEGGAGAMARLREETEKTAALQREASAKAVEDGRREWSVTTGNADAMANLARQLEAAKQKRLDDSRATFAASQAQSIFSTETDNATVSVVAQTAALADREASLQRIADAEAARKAAVDKFMNAPTLNDRESDVFSTDLRQLTQADLANIQAEMDPFRQDVGGTSGIWKKLAELEAREGTVRPSNNKEFFALQREAMLLAQLRMWAEGQDRPPSFAGGVENFTGGLAYVHKNEMLVNMPRGTDVIPAGGGGGGAVNLGGIHFHGPTFGAAADFEAAVKSAVTELMRKSGKTFIPLA